MFSELPVMRGHLNDKNADAKHLLKKHKRKYNQNIKANCIMLSGQILFTKGNGVYFILFLTFFFFWSLNTGELKNLVSENLSPRLILLQNEEMKRSKSSRNLNKYKWLKDFMYERSTIQFSPVERRLLV